MPLQIEDEFGTRSAADAADVSEVIQGLGLQPIVTGFTGKADTATVNAALALKLDAAVASPITATKSAVVGADTSIILDSADSFNPKLVTETARQTAMLALVRGQSQFVKVRRDLTFRESANVAADLTPTYITHLDILPSEFDFPDAGWSAECEFIFEGGLKGADQFATVSVGTLTKEVRFYIGIPGGATATFVDVTNSHGFIQTAAQRSSSTSFFFTATPESLGQVLESQNIGGGATSYGSTANALSKPAARNYRASGLRVLLSGLFGAQGAGHIIKVRSLKVTLDR
jgi:hypothetical protein